MCSDDGNWWKRPQPLPFDEPNSHRDNSPSDSGKSRDNSSFDCGKSRDNSPPDSGRVVL